MRKIILAILCVFTLGVAHAQEKEISIEDAVLGYYKGLYPEYLYGISFISDSDNFLYNDYKNGKIVIKNPANEVFQEIDFQTLKEKFPEASQFPSLETAIGDEMVFNTGNGVAFYNYVKGENTGSINLNEDAENLDYNKKIKAAAYTVKNNLFVATTDNSEIAVTQITNENIVSGQSIHRNEFGISKGTFWSPKGNYLAFYQKDETNVTNYPLVDITTRPATLKNIKYPMAGQGSEIAKIGIFNMDTHKKVYLNIDTSDEHYLTNFSWSDDEQYVFVAELNREQNHMWFNRYDAKTGEKINTLFEEENDAYVEPLFPAVNLPNKGTLLYMSQRNGYMNIYEYTMEGKLVKQLTDYKWIVKDILGFDAKEKYLYITGTGRDPREMHAFKVSLKNGKTTQLTTVAASHNIQISDDRAYILDFYSSLTTPNNYQIINTNKGTSNVILESENPLKDYKLGVTEMVSLKAADGTTNLYGRLIKPADFDPNKKYPVLVYVYGGPHAQMVTNSWLAGASLWMTAFASKEDYLVFTLDNRGSSSRGFEFESVIHRNVGDNEMADQLEGVKYLKSLPYVDASRMAVHGWSFGGFMTSSLMLRHPGVFTTGVAGGPVIDWDMYEVMYGERYMDTPQENPDGYDKTSVENYIKNLKGKLMLIIGSVDPVVVPEHSMTLLKAAVDNGVQLDFFTYPMHEHNVRGKDRVHLMIKVLDYIVEHNK
ncbi:peptidase S9 [Neptunitalea chrysea]|uniref:Peptidase S9 n=1 Tax=Neptunitalea chrysea TaxID=1647581 RepID=A0A9W6EVC7_9FLAO|nr:DPP IV N-terminal domain-containing protein [Neptunitalea chrysea]GLB53659.1 peptidase S9 [Neptunitalea chrysea]